MFHLALLAVTFVTTTLAGGLAFSEGGGLLRGGQFSDGFAFSIPLLTILGIHELGHYGDVPAVRPGGDAAVLSPVAAA